MRAANIQSDNHVSIQVLIEQLGNAKGSQKNKLAIWSVAAPGWQGAKSQEYLDIPMFCKVAGWDASASKTVGYFLVSPKSSARPVAFTSALFRQHGVDWRDLPRNSHGYPFFLRCKLL
ncbi:MAG: hypothetical protein WBN03_03285 [Desulfobacterales bacterium]